MTTRVRFAPSPTGDLHIGGARTALFNWLYARHTGGTFVLRIEDTDASRNSAEAVEVILDGLRWLGLDWDEGPTDGNPDSAAKGPHGPYFQSRRGDIYQKRVKELLAKGAAYEDAGAVRFRMTREAVVVPDMVVGNVRREVTDREALEPDFVIVRSDGAPVFHLVNVIDDLEMGITHVIRGEDHLSNTAKHIELFKAFGAEPPKYAHIPLILNPDGSKMAKRDKGASMRAYMKEGFVSEAVFNYLCLLGWSPKDNREVLAPADVVQRFDLPQILRHNARFDMTKLLWLNGDYIKRMDADHFTQHATAALARDGIETSRYPAEYVKAALATCREKLKLFTETKPWVDFYFVDEVTFDPEASAKEIKPKNKPLVQKIRDAIAAEPEFKADALNAMMKRLSTELGIGIGPLVHPTRLGCTGKTVGPSLYHLMEILGRDRVLARMDRLLKLFPN